MFKQSFIAGFPVGAQRVGHRLSILERDLRVTYFVDGDNYFSHKAGDEKAKRYALACLIENEHVRVCDVERAPLSIPHRTVMNWLTQYRRDGSDSFFRSANPLKPRVMTADKRAECARLLADHHHPAEVAKLAGIKESTLRKALARKAIPTLPGIVPTGAEEGSDQPAGSTKSERSRTDSDAATEMGMACTRADERVACAMGLALCASSRFEAGCDVQMAGLLTGLPALCANGLFSGLDKHFTLPKGFYSALHILLVLGFMALGRIRRPEGLRHIPPGEFGKVIGLDRVPEVRTLREKIATLAANGNPAAWMQELSKTWMEAEPEEASYLYVDGHVRVYHGATALLPRRFVSRERLCLRGTTDYWVNDAIGRPFFVVSKAVTDGLADTLLKDIVPALLNSVPQQPTQQELDADPRLHRFVIVFDREGATHSLLSQLWKQRIGALTYRKNVKDVWPVDEFLEQQVAIPAGGSASMKLAMRETTLGADKNAIAVTEVRRLTESGHQTAIITTAQHLGNTVIASRMFSRWCQENFFAYMMQHYDIDGLIEYGAQPLPGTLLIVNPVRRELEKTIKRCRTRERAQQAKVAKYSLQDSDNIHKTAESVEALQEVQEELKLLRGTRADTPKKVTIDSLPEQQRPTQLKPLNKILTDTVKMIAYRAETAMVTMLRPYLHKEEEARALVRELFISSADIEPDDVARTLTVRVHHFATSAHNKAIAALLEDLNKLKFCHPETGAKMIYSLV